MKWKLEISFEDAGVGSVDNPEDYSPPYKYRVLKKRLQEMFEEELEVSLLSFSLSKLKSAS